MSNDEAVTCPSHLTQNRVDPSDPRNIPPGAAAQKAKQTDKVYYTSRVYVVLALPSPIINARAGKKKKKKSRALLFERISFVYITKTCERLA